VRISTPDSSKWVAKECLLCRARHKCHRFVIRTLRHWYRTNKDVEAHLPELATYIGHAHVSDTYWYISAAPELLQLATERLERNHGAPVS
jgi:hypothetical protein